MWQFNLDSKPAQITVAGPDFSTEGVDDAFADTQAQPAAALGAASRPVYPIQSIKQTVQRVWRDTGSGILKGQNQSVCAALLPDLQ
jgi:hypothetical protein